MYSPGGLMAALLAGYILITSIKNHVATPYDLTNYYMILILGKRERTIDM